jgi:hypothetical protein
MAIDLSYLFEISLDRANQFYTWGWRASLIGSLVTFFGVVFLYWGTRVRDHDFEHNIAHLHGSAALSEERSRQLERSNLELATVLERERAARVHIEAGLASRHVRSDQRTAFKKVLDGTRLTVVLSSYSDQESTGYASEITSALTDAGVTVKAGSRIMATTSALSGLYIENNADELLFNAFALSGLATQKLPAERNDMFMTGHGLNAIVVGLKPNPF